MSTTYAPPVAGQRYWALVSTASSLPLIPGEAFGVRVADRPTGTGPGRVYERREHAEAEMAMVPTARREAYAVRAVAWRPPWRTAASTGLSGWAWADDPAVA